MDNWLINKKKYYTPREISAIGVLFIVILLSVFSFFVLNNNPLRILLFTLFSIVVVYFFFNYLIEIFLNRKIKLIYKSIHNIKTSKEEEERTFELNSNPIEQIQDEVDNWSQAKKEEIAQLKKVEQFRKEFLANLSHELKTPLFNIQGYVHTLIDEEVDDPETRKYFLERTSKSIERLGNLISDLDEISRLERGETTVHPSIFDIHRLIGEVFEGLELKAAKKHIRMSFKKDSDHSLLVYADKDKIKQVLYNLLENSIKYGKENGETLAGLYDLEDAVLVELTDNGIGVEEEHLPRLFERFYRVDRHRSREQGGTGLGLAIVKHIIEAHHQTINVRSKLGVGTTFGFSLQKLND